MLLQVVGTDIQNSLFNPPPSYRYLGRVSTDRQEAKHTEVIDNTQMSVHIVGASWKFFPSSRKAINGGSGVDRVTWLRH